MYTPFLKIVFRMPLFSVNKKLNKKVVANLDGGEMNQLRGGVIRIAYLCPTESQNFCPLKTDTCYCPLTTLIIAPIIHKLGMDVMLKLVNGHIFV
jgi:hypothetical protein